MKSMKVSKILVLVAFTAALSITLLPSNSDASLLPPVDGGSYDQGALNPVRFYVVDTSSDGEALLSASSYGASGFALQYSYTNSGFDWASFASPLLVDMDSQDYKLIYLRMYNSGTPAEDTDGILEFQSYQGVDNGLYLFTSSVIDWGISPFKITFNSTPDDSLAPVPIPTTAVLFGSALLCLVGIRMRRGEAP